MLGDNDDFISRVKFEERDGGLEADDASSVMGQSAIVMAGWVEYPIMTISGIFRSGSPDTLSLFQERMTA